MALVQDTTVKHGNSKLYQVSNLEKPISCSYEVKAEGWGMLQVEHMCMLEDRALSDTSNVDQCVEATLFYEKAK